MTPTAENLRYLLWRTKVRRADWVKHLASWVECSEQRAEELLHDGILQDQEQQRIAERAEISSEDLQNNRFLGDRVDILRKNLQFLTDKKQIGEKIADIARSTKINSVTLSRWKKGSQKPENAQLQKLCEHFGLPSSTNLRTDAVFLELSVVGDVRKREWLRTRIDSLSSKTLRELYPAFKRLFKDS